MALKGQDVQECGSVLICDEHILVAEGIAKLVSDGGWDARLGPHPDELLGLHSVSDCELVIVSFAVVNPLLVQKIGRLCAARSSASVLVLFPHVDRFVIRKMIQAGAAGVVSKGRPASELLRAVQLVARGAGFVCPDSSAGVEVPAWGELTPREFEVLRRLCTGVRSRVVANQLGLSLRTIEAHKYSAMRKLDAHSILEVDQMLRRGVATRNLTACQGGRSDALTPRHATARPLE